MGEGYLTLVDNGGGILERGEDVGLLEVGVVAKELLGGSPGGELAEDHADGDAEVSDAGDSAHLVRVDSYALEGHGCDATPRTGEVALGLRAVSMRWSTVVPHSPEPSTGSAVIAAVIPVMAKEVPGADTGRST